MPRGLNPLGVPKIKPPKNVAPPKPRLGSLGGLQKGLGPMPGPSPLASPAPDMPMPRVRGVKPAAKTGKTVVKPVMRKSGRYAGMG